jgi:hypothetical protein
MRDAIEMARQSGWEMDDSLVLEPEVIWYMSQGQLERLVAIVRADERESIKAICKAEQTDDSADLWNVCCTHLINKINKRNV